MTICLWFKMFQVWCMASITDDTCAHSNVGSIAPWRIEMEVAFNFINDIVFEHMFFKKIISHICCCCIFYCCCCATIFFNGKCYKCTFKMELAVTALERPTVWTCLCVCDQMKPKAISFNLYAFYVSNLAEILFSATVIHIPNWLLYPLIWYHDNPAEWTLTFHGWLFNTTRDIFQHRNKHTTIA